MIGPHATTAQLPLASSRRLTAAVLATLAGWFVVVALVTGVWRDVPLIDDWTYAWTVEHLLRSGQLAVLDWSSAYPVFQAFWGGIWSTLLGFSFFSLRLSTLVLAVIGCYALYLMLRELGTSPRVALIGSLTLAVNPIFVFLSSSFMTDVPFTTFTTLTLLCYVRAANRADARWIWWAGAWALAALLVRQVGLITPVAGLPLLLHPRLPRIRAAVPLLATVAALGVVFLALRAMLGTTSVMEKWSWNLMARPDSYMAMNAPLAVQVCFSILPALLAAATLVGVWRRPVLLAAIVAAAAAILFAALGTIPSPLAPEQTWTLQEVGSSQILVGGHLPPPPSSWISFVLAGIGLLAIALLILVALRPGGWLRGWSAAHATLLLFIGTYFVLMNLLWMYLDRYAMALLPPLIALTLAGIQSAPRVPRLAAATLAVFAIVALLGTRGALLFNQAVRDTWQSLVDAGVPASHIDAGYAWNGWVLYAHPRNLAPGQTPLEDVPWVTSDEKREYVIAKSPIEGYTVVREVSRSDLPWPGPVRLLVLRQMPEGEIGAQPSP